MASHSKHYVYLVSDGVTPLCIGKGTGRRMAVSAKKHGGEARVIEHCSSEELAFERERYWIAELLPVNNICSGGGGGRCKPKSPLALPKMLEGIVSKESWRRQVRLHKAKLAEIEAIGGRKYAARLILRFIRNDNCEQWGLSKVELSRLHGVAHG